MRELLADCRHAVRLYLRTPAASLIAVAVLAIGMAFVAAFVSLCVDLILRPHPGFEASKRIVTYGVGDSGLLLAEWIDRIDAESATLEAAAGVAPPESFLVGPDREPITSEVVSSRFFDGVWPTRRRWILRRRRNKSFPRCTRSCGPRRRRPSFALNCRRSSIPVLSKSR